MTYEAFRHFADSWWLALMVLAYVFLVGWSFRPSKRDSNARAARMIFDEDENDG
ncbi:cbb3-type cytochrome c oxidase subunit 3 [Sphingomonas sp. HDW15A]|uniref:cbb3-type cytochrome c oxidase subunit 3 n=1 Tax=Sphingomonas sp. HDW15A TaxID=2714942 RepID=UPI00140D1F1A|nr:cbb3-type cytochrome c oxidase subunit 3 [Sphingomonas sp. HDW15A]QIK95755.1 cbb3-type cytochrome c oxidase subunit 3 [Sphingomonas sp. HDW15A]